MTTTIKLDGHSLTRAQLVEVAHGATVELDAGALQKVERAAQFLAAQVAREEPIYGVSTGFGSNADKLLGAHPLRDELPGATKSGRSLHEELQYNLIVTHAVCVGEPMAPEIVRAMLGIRINTLLKGHSGIRVETLQAMAAMLNAGIVPVVPSLGSVGASGDLAPLAHMSLVLLGESQARHKGQWLPATEALAIAGLEPMTLAAKEGLALLNGTQVSTAYALRGLFEAEDLYAAASVCGALSVEALLGSRSPFDARIHNARGQRGQIDAAAAFRHLLGDSSEIGRSHAACDKVQDPYSLRCQPQVMGACLTQLRQAAEVLAVGIVLDRITNTKHVPLGTLCDNTPTVSWIDKMASKSKSPTAGRLLRGLAFMLYCAHAGRLTTVHVIGVDNVMADIASRPSKAQKLFRADSPLSDLEFCSSFDTTFPLLDNQVWSLATVPHWLRFNVFEMLRGK